MKKIIPFLLLTLFLIACSAGNAIATLVPTAIQQIAPTSDQASMPTVLPATVQPPVGQAPLAGTTWNWIGFTGPNEQVKVEAPVNYSLVFQSDGTVNITADCNNATGSYQVDGQSIKIQVGPMTKAICPPGSYSDEFIRYLESPATYSLQDGNLYIDLTANGGTLVFSPAERLASQSGKGAVLDALLANPWQWISFTNPVTQYDVTPSENYLLTFHSDGTLEVKADCNNASGTYILDGSTISIVLGPATLAACPPGSHSDDFLKYLDSAAIYFFQPGELYIDMVADGGTMKFIPLIQ
jgi:heat shock protein HslJ